MSITEMIGPVQPPDEKVFDLSILFTQEPLLFLLHVHQYLLHQWPSLS